MHSGGQPGGATANRSLTNTASNIPANNTPAVQVLKNEASSQNVVSVTGAVSTGTPKNKKRERPCDNTNSEPSKRERPLEPDEPEPSKLDAVKTEDVSNILGEDGGLGSIENVEKMVVTMQQDRNEGGRKPSDVFTRRTFLAAAIAATENHDCLDRFVQLGGVPLLHDWLQEAHKGKPGDSEGCKDGNKVVDELLLTIVSALEKLPVDLDALRTCLVGKSVNNLRNHRNHEIKDKAKRLVETWKKRVDEEVNSTSEIKPAPGHTTSWSTNKVGLEQPTGAKTSASNGAGNCTKYKQGSKEDKGSQSPSNGWGNHTVNPPTTWKDDGKTSTSPSPGCKANNSNGRPSTKVLSGLNPTASQKDSTMGKPVVWRNDKGAEALAPPEASSHKLILRLPNPGRGSSASVTGEVFGPGSQGSSPNVAEQASTSGVVEASDTKHRLHPCSGQQQQQQVDVAAVSVKPDETEKTQQAATEHKSEASRISVGISTAIVPVSAASRISRNADATIVSEIDTVDNQEATVERDAVEPPDCKQDGARKDALDRGNVGNCPSSSSFTEMSVAGQGGDVKTRGDETSSAGVTTDEENKPRLEQEGLGESPEPRPKRSEESSFESPKHTVDQQPSGEAHDNEKRCSADVSCTQGLKIASFSGRGSYDPLGRRDRHDNNTWDDSKFDCKSSSESGCRKNGVEQEIVRKEFSSKLGDGRRNDSTEFMEDDSLDIAQQIAKEVVEEMEDREKRPSKDAAKLYRDTVPVQEADKQENVEVELVKTPIADHDVGEQENSEEKKAECEEECPVPSLKAVEDEKVDVPSIRVEEKQVEVAAASGTSRPDFDLNEGFGGDEGFKEVPVSSPVPVALGPMTPIAVLPATKGAFIPPESLMKGKSETGWKGSAATSAFRPAEPRKFLETHIPQAAESNNPGKSVRAPLDIDLNVADEDVVLDLGSFPSSSSRPKQVSSSRQTVEFDLNCTDECEDGVDVKSDISRRDGCGVTRDFDLNGPMVDDMCEEPRLIPQLNLRSSDNSTGTSSVTTVPGYRDVVNVAPWFPQSNSFSMPAFPMVRAESGYPVPGQQFLNAGAAAAAAASGGAIHFNMDLYRANGMTLAPPAVTYPTVPQVSPYQDRFPGPEQAGIPSGNRWGGHEDNPYVGFPFASNYSFSTSAAFPTASGTYVDAASYSAAAAAASQLGGPMSRFIRPHLMGNTSAWVRPSLDLNTGPDSETGVPSSVPHAMNNGRGVQLEDHLRGFRQVAPPAASGKRKEPEGGWEAFQAAGYKQPAWC